MYVCIYIYIYIYIYEPYGLEPFNRPPSVLLAPSAGARPSRRLGGSRLPEAPGAQVQGPTGVPRKVLGSL